LKKILVPFDGSGYSEKAYEQALEIAEKFESELTVMTVIQSKISDSSGMSLTRMQEIQDEEEDAATAMLKTLEDRAKTKNVSFSIKIVQSIIFRSNSRICRWPQHGFGCHGISW